MKRQHWFVMTSLLLVASLLLGNFASSSAQPSMALILDSVNDQNFPVIETYLSVSDGQGYPIAGLAKDNFSLAEDGQPIASYDLSTLNQKPISVVLAVDVREIMGWGGETTYLEQVIQSLNVFIDTLGPDDAIGLVKINAAPEVMQGLTTDKAAVKAAVNALQPEDYANINDGIVTAVNLLQNIPGRRAVVLVSNGPDSQVSKVTFELALSEAMHQQVIFFPITWGGAKKDLMQQLAELTHGQAQYLGIDPPTQQALDAAFVPLGEWLNALRAQYKLNFQSAVQADGKVHNLLVKLDYMGTHLEQTISFNALQGTVTVSLPDLQNGQTIGGQVNLAPAVVAPSGLAKIDILLDGQPLTSKSVAPFEYLWDTTTVTEGEHVIDITATDASGNSGQTSVSVVVQAPISVVITSPAEGLSVEGKVNLVAEVTALFPVTRVEFSVDNKPLPPVTTAPYQVEWDTKGGEGRQHRIAVQAFDDRGYSASAGPVTVSVPGGGIGPWVAILAAAALAAIMIPIALRGRRNRQTVEVMPTDLPGGGPIAGGGGLSNASLRELDGLTPNQVYPLAGDEIRIGRKREDNDIPAKGLSASRQHAIIRRYGNQHVIESVKPENPAIVNDQPVMGQQTLQNGDLIRIGETLLRYEAY